MYRAENNPKHRGRFQDAERQRYRFPDTCSPLWGNSGLNTVLTSFFLLSYSQVIKHVAPDPGFISMGPSSASEYVP